MSMPPPKRAPEVDRDAADVVKLALGDIFYRVRRNELRSAVAMPYQVLLELLAGVPGRSGQALAACNLQDLPCAAWDEVRRRYPEAAALPLGSVAEMAVKRFLGRLVQQDPGRSGLTMSKGRVLFRYLSYFLFETAMLDLRGHAPDLSADNGFWYHWMPGGQLRSLEQESQMRARLWPACQRLAVEILGHWARIRRPEVLCPSEQELDDLWGTVIGRGLMDASGWRLVGNRPWVTVLGLRPSAEQKKEFGPLRYNAKLIVVRGEDANVDLDLRHFARYAGGKLHSLMLDLIDIAATIYLADIHVPRHRLLFRDLVFLMPVRHPQVWDKHERTLAQAVSFLSRNRAEFRFTSSGGAKSAQARWRTTSDDRCVALFSGGLDSFAGAVHLLSGKRNPMLVSHHPNPKLLGIQSGLVEALRKGYPGLVSARVKLGRAGRDVAPLTELGEPPRQVLYQHTRSFLFLSLASVLAIGNGIADVCVPENGPVALNPAFSEARFNTRTMHPAFLSLFRDLIRGVFEVELRIRNPFELLTKAQVLAGLDERWVKELKHTNSCWSYNKTPVFAKYVGCKDFLGGHCGRCLPCMWRRAAVLRAGLQELDDTYLWDNVAHSEWGRWLRRRHFTGLLDQWRFCQRALVDDDKTLLDACPDFYERGPGTVQERLAMYRRFSGEMVDWFESIGEQMWYRPDAERRSDRDQS